MARSLDPVSLLDGEIPADQHVERPDSSAQTPREQIEPAERAKNQGLPRPDEVPVRASETSAATNGGARRAEAASQTKAEPKRRPRRRTRLERTATPAVHGHPEHVALMLPPALWESYDELAFDLSEAGGARVSTSALIKAVLLHHLPGDEDEAHRLAVDWLEVRSAEDDPYGHEAPVQRNLLLYASQRGALDRLARRLKRRRLPGARSKLICAVLHFRRPADVAEARELVRRTRLAPHRDG